MNKKSVIAVLLLVLMAAALLGGLPLMTKRVLEKHKAQPVVVTVAPMQLDEDTE